MTTGRQTRHDNHGDADTEDNLSLQQHRWTLACTALALLKQEPAALNGMLISSEFGHVHQAFLTQLANLFKIFPVPISVSPERLTGALDISQTLAASAPVYQKGLLEMTGGALLINGAERLETTPCALLSAYLDQHDDNQSVVICIDESTEDEPGIAESSLADKLSMFVTLPALSLAQLERLINEAPDATDTQSLTPTLTLGDVVLPDTLLQELTQLAERLGVSSLRTLISATRVAKAHAKYQGRSCVTVADAALAAQLVLAPRATSLAEASPEQEEQQSDEDVSDNEIDNDESSETQQPEAPEPSELEDHEEQPENIGEQLLAAVEASLPQNLIAELVRGQAIKSQAGRDTNTKSSKGTKGRPTGVRRPRGGLRVQRLNLLETLKCAAPQQRLRGNHKNRLGRLQIRVDDFRVTRFKQPTRTTTVFVVDASGSAALHRLAEAKGAVELLLAECYVRRDRVSMISFRGTKAELSLPPTRSLVRAKRELANLPGGGGTPLAAGMDMAIGVVNQLKQAGESAVVVLMTDGKANITRSGESSRATAQAEAHEAAKQLAASGARCLFIDTAPRPRPIAAELAASLQARYLPLPSLDTRQLPELVRN